MSKLNGSIKEGIWLNNGFDARISTLITHSEVLKNNPWGDPTERRHFVYTPKSVIKKSSAVVLYLPGYLSGAAKSFSFKGHESNFFETLLCIEQKDQLPHARFISVDAWTKWGGSQYIDSQGMGKYESSILQELVPILESHYSCGGKLAVIGGSSGGYGALRLMRSGKFKAVAAIAPDSFFDASLLPDIYKAAPSLQKFGTVAKILEALDSEKLQKSRSYFPVVNSVAMGLCYAPNVSPSGVVDVHWPIDFETGRLISNVWSQWLAHDPIHFLKEFKSSDVKLYLSAGKYDEFNLQFGTQQLSRLLEGKVKHTFNLFDGNHRDLSQDWPNAMSWLKENI